MIALDELKIPAGVRPVADEIVSITDSVCLSILDEEYADLARRAVAKLARKRPSPLRSGRRATWAAGVVNALGYVNFLSDPASKPYATADQLAGAFGVAKSTMGGKGKQVRDLLKMRHFGPEFQRADVAAQNPLAWTFGMSGLGPDATGDQAAAEPGLLDRCSDLKGQLVEFGRSRRFSEQLGQALSGLGQVVDELDFINAMDHFILQRPLPDGSTVVESFVEAHPELPETDREMLLGWRDVVEGVFEVKERDGDAIIVVNLIDELTYRVYANAGPAALAAMQPGTFVIGRIVPVAIGWMLSGAQHTLGAFQRAGAATVAAEMATRQPQLVFRNPDRVRQGWELARKQRAVFIEFFGSDLVVVPGSELAARMNDFLSWYSDRAASGPDAGATPTFRAPGDLASAPTVALICDETEGLTFFGDFGLLREAFGDPALAADSEHREAVLGYLESRSISTLPFDRLASADTARASQLFQHLLNKPGFSWERDGEALLREHKPWCFEAERHPPVTPLSHELTHALQSS